MAGLPTAHLTAMVAMDDATELNGCLNFAPGRHDADSFQLTAGGCLRDEDERRLEWRALEVKEGDVVFFSGWSPHRSSPNRSDRSRRAMFLTYNPASHGDWHDAYYAEKLKRNFGNGQASASKEEESPEKSLSFIDHFTGTHVD